MQMQALLHNARSIKCMGYLPWKLLISDIIMQHRDDEFAAQVKPCIENAVNILKTILCDSPTPCEKVHRFYQIFTNTGSRIDACTRLYLEDINNQDVEADIASMI
jgi:hypothetical protein